MDYPPGDEHGRDCCCLECQAVRDHLALERLEQLSDREREHRLITVLFHLNQQRKQAH